MNRRRFEILLPARFNDGREVMESCMTCFARTMGDVLDQFGAFSWMPQALQGSWRHDDDRYDDELFKLTIDAPDTAEARDFITDLQRQLLDRFDQIEIYVVSFPVEIHESQPTTDK